MAVSKFKIKESSTHNEINVGLISTFVPLVTTFEWPKEPEKLFLLARSYMQGEGVEKDEKLGFEWMMRAAKQGSSGAQNDLGVMYQKGLGVSKNEELACQWYLLAAEQGLANAQFNLGGMYLDGRGIEKNAKLAYEWYRRSAEQGNSFAQNNLGDMCLHGKGVEKDLKLAFEWFQKAANQGVEISQNSLAFMYFNGLAVVQDKKLALYWFQKSAEQGCKNAQFNLAMIYEAGEGVEKNEKLALELYSQAANQGHPLAQLNLGCMYANGRGVAKDEKLAFQWVQQAAEQGLAHAQYNLGLMYREGKGVTTDEKKAHEWYLKAAEQEFIFNGRHPLFWASDIVLIQCIHSLAEKDINLNVKNADGDTPLIYALSKNYLSYARTLLEAKADVNEPGNLGKTPLHYAAEFDYASHFITFLLELKANLNAKDSQGRTPLTWAENLNKRNAIEFFKIMKTGEYGFQRKHKEHLQLLANLVEEQYLLKYPSDHLLEVDRKTLEEVVIPSIVRAGCKLIFKCYEEDFQRVQQELKIKEEALQESLVGAFCKYLKEFCLYQRQAEIFWKPYIEMFLYDDNGKGSGKLAFPEELPNDITYEVVQCYKGIVSPVCGISKNENSLYSQKQANLCSRRLVKGRIKWLCDFLFKQQKDPKKSKDDEGDRKVNLEKASTKLKDGLAMGKPLPMKT